MPIGIIGSLLVCTVLYILVPPSPPALFPTSNWTPDPLPWLPTGLAWGGWHR
jgi:amino acid transporter